MTKLQSIAQMRRALQMFTALLPDDSALQIAEVYPKWETDKAYLVNDICGYGENAVGDTQLYRCLQGHTSQTAWTPDVAVSLWKTIGIDPEGYPEWSQPVGAADAYSLGDTVSHGGKHWVSIVDNNVWEPGVYGWSEE